MGSALELSRDQILAQRRRTGALDARLPAGAEAWRQAAAVFTLGRWPEDSRGQQRALRFANALEALLGGGRSADPGLDRALGVQPWNAKYAATTGRVLIRWDGARAPEMWCVPAPEVDPARARLELARRYLHVLGPGTAASFAEWAGISARSAQAAFAGLANELMAVSSPLGDASILAVDEAGFRDAPGPAAPARLLPSGDAYSLLHGAGRELLVPDPARRAELWPSRVWPGALLVDGELRGIWRRAGELVRIHTWRPPRVAERAAVEAEAATLPLPGRTGQVSVVWE